MTRCTKDTERRSPWKLGDYICGHCHCRRWVSEHGERVRVGVEHWCRPCVQAKAVPLGAGSPYYTREDDGLDRALRAMEDAG